jgi:hypothetical protein
MGHKVVINRCFGGFGLSQAAVEWLQVRGADDKVKSSSFFGTHHHWTGDRHDPLLVECVETLGSERASGHYADLEVVEIFGNQYRIDEYDGQESVEEPSDIGWVTIEDACDPD